ncbi:hypothetical protein SAMN05216327_118138 [Dyadobacter sp. SG02]|nr:hypothetical protein SAMN05216327_118138 [Dyadobacter sp. SG02]
MVFALHTVGNMKETILIYVSILIAGGSLSGCSDVDPERAAVIIQRDYTMCGACGGWFVQIDSVQYRADVAAPYNKEFTPVWIRFKKDESDGLKVWGRWINITSIRNRE